MADPLSGKTLRWTFDDGPTAGVEYEHSFDDGLVSYRQVDGKSTVDAGGHSSSYEVAKVRQGVIAVSYLAASGFTLTSILDLDAGRVVAFASNEDQLVLQRGTFAEVQDRQRPPRPAAGQRSRTKRAVA